MRTSIWCTFQVSGVHCWPGAPNYLQFPHRHLFHYRVEMSVWHDDREVEFIQWKDELAQFVRTEVLFDSVFMSCEQLAKNMITHLLLVYGERDYVVEVSEDGENGAKVSRDSGTCR